jgi:HAD superfamily hydrolase (TIGR01509 family)
MNMDFRNIKAVLFDLDGTLVDSMWVWKEIDITYLGNKGIPMPADLQKNIEGMSMRETAVYFQEQFHITDDLEIMMAEWVSMAFDTYAHRVNYKPGGEEFLKFLRTKGIKTGICTSNSPELLQVVADKLQMSSYIDCFLTANEVAHGKPSPDIYLEMAKRLQVAPADCLVFEDILPGIQAGQAAGMKVCTIDDDYSADVLEEKRQLADYYIKDYTQIQY